MMKLRGALGIAVVVLMLSTAACTPEQITDVDADATTAPETQTPAPDAIKPALADLVLSPDGLGPLVVGQPLSEDTPGAESSAVDMAYFDSNCATAPEGSDARELGMWRANYPDLEEGLPPFVPVIEGDTLTAIAVHSAEIKTAKGLHLGSPRSDVLAAYPQGFSSQFDHIIDDWTLSTVYVIDGNDGMLVIEVESDDSGLLSEGEVETILALTVLVTGSTPFAIAASDNYYWGGCFTF